MSQFGQFGVPTGKTRLAISIIVAFLIGLLLFWKTATSDWFTLTRQLYLVFGVTAGLLLGALEPRIVLPKLEQNTEAIIWKVTPIGTALFAAPLLLSMAFFGVSEYVPFGLYGLLPSLPAITAVSGWYFNKFEKENKVQVFVFYWGWKYWKEPNPDVRERFYYFIRDLASNNSSIFWLHVGYAKRFMEVLEERQDIDSSAKQDLCRILKLMNKYRVIGLVGFGLFLFSIVAIFVLLFGTGYGVFNWDFSQTADVLMPVDGVIFLCFAVGVFGMISLYKKRISRILATIDPEKLSSI